MIRFRSVLAAALALALAAELRADEHGRWEQMPLQTTGFGGTLGGDWVWHCNLCGGKTWRLPTRHVSQRDGWLKAHLSGHGVGGASGAVAPARSLQELGSEAIAKGIVHKNSEMVGYGVAAIGADLFMNMLFSGPSGPSPQDVARQRLRESERVNRALNARASAEDLQKELLGNAARLRKEYEHRDAERSERLGGAFDVIRPTRFFGDPPGASEEEIAAVLDVDKDSFGLFDGRGTVLDFEAALRDPLSIGEGVPLHGIPEQVDPLFLDQQRIRAQETEAFNRARLPSGQLPPLAGDTRYVSPVDRVKDAAVAMARQRLEDLKQQMLKEISISGFQNARELYEKQKAFIEDVFKTLDPEKLAQAALNGEVPKEFLYASEHLGMRHLRRFGKGPSETQLSTEEAVSVATREARFRDVLHDVSKREVISKASEWFQTATGVSVDTAKGIIEGGQRAVDVVQRHVPAPPDPPVAPAVPSPFPAPAAPPAAPAPPRPAVAPTARAVEIHYGTKDGVEIPPALKERVEEIAASYYRMTGKTITVTDGSRTVQDQADAMFDKLQGKDGFKYYKNARASGEIRKVYEETRAVTDDPEKIKQAMRKKIEEQVAKGTYVSNHLKSRALDIRSKDMSPAQKEAFEKAAAQAGIKPCEEGDPPHYHLEFK